MGHGVDILAQGTQLFYFFDLTLDDVEHFVQVFKVWVNLRLLLNKIETIRGINKQKQVLNHILNDLPGQKEANRGGRRALN